MSDPTVIPGSFNGTDILGRLTKVESGLASLTQTVQAIQALLPAPQQQPPPPVVVGPPPPVLVTPDQSLQSAMDAAKPGDTLLLMPGATYVGPFVAKPKDGTDRIRITTQGADKAIPQGQTIDPSMAPQMAKLAAPGGNPSAFQTAIVGGVPAAYWTLDSLEIAPLTDQTITGDLILLGDGTAAQNDASLAAHDLEILRCYIHGAVTKDCKRGINANCGSMRVAYCWISEIHRLGQEAQGIGGWNGPGGWVIEDNHIEASTQSILMGGARPTIPNLVITNVKFRRNYCTRPLSWWAKDPTFAGIKWDVKNCFEIKNADEVECTDNVFENVWGGDQDGTIILLKASYQGSTTNPVSWSQCSNVLFARNKVRHAAAGVNVAGQVNPFANVVISDNTFEDINGLHYTGDGTLFKVSNGNGLTLEHNVAFQTGNFLYNSQLPVNGLVVNNNIAPYGSYGINGTSSSQGMPALTKYFPGATFNGNVLVGKTNVGKLYPAGISFAPDMASVGFVDLAGGNYALSDTSPYKPPASPTEPPVAPAPTTAPPSTSQGQQGPGTPNA